MAAVLYTSDSYWLPVIVCASLAAMRTSGQMNRDRFISVTSTHCLRKAPSSYWSQHILTQTSRHRLGRQAATRTKTSETRKAMFRLAKDPDSYKKCEKYLQNNC